MHQDGQKFFENPPNEFRIAPFWFWNGALDEAEIIYQIQEMASKGVGGFFICARQGMEIPYLSDLWFERVKLAIKTAARYGLEVWLYDEYPYPSGMSGGEVVLQHPDAKQHNLLHLNYEVSGPHEFVKELPWARVLAAKAVPYNPQSSQLNWEGTLDLQANIGNIQAQTVFQKTGLTQYNQKRYFTYGPIKKLTWKVPAGNWRVIIFVEKEIEDFKFFGTFFDPCHAAAVQTFLRTTHDRYARLLTGSASEAIKGIFSDEVGLYGNPPWSPQLSRFFVERQGYSLEENLLALQYPMGDTTSRVRYDYFQSLHLLLRSSYHQQVKEWCQKHGLQYVAEVPALRMTTQYYSDIPGGDSAHEKLGRSLEWALDHYALNLRSNPKMVSSLARQLGREKALIECFHSVGWSMTLQDAKWMIDRMAAMGINFFNFHAFFYTLDGLRKHDAPPSQFLQNPYWPHFKKLTDYAARLSYLLSQGHAKISIAVLDPTTSFWTHLGNPFQQFGYFGADPQEERELNQLKADWVSICKTLTFNQLDYDHLDPEMLAQAQMDNAGNLVIGKATYSIIVLPPLTNLEAAAWTKLKEFLERGGTVVSLGLLPYEVIDHQHNLEEEMLEWFGLTADNSPRQDYWQTISEGIASTSHKPSWVKGKYSAYFLPCSGGISDIQKAEFVSFIRKELSLSITLEASETAKSSLLTHQRACPDGSHLIFLTNQESQQIEVEIKVEQAAFEALEVEELNLETGESILIGVGSGERSWKIPLQLTPYESRFFRLSSGQQAPSKHSKSYAALKISAGGQWAFSALQPNVLRFGTFRFGLDLENEGIRQNWQSGEAGANWPEVEAKTLIDQFDDLAKAKRLALPLKFSQTFGTPIRPGLDYPLACWYQTSFEVEDLPANCRLRMDASAIQGDYTIYLNGREITANVFEAVREYDICNRSCEVGKLLLKGQNRLVVRVEAHHDWDGLTDPLYLAGDFGVSTGTFGQKKLAKAPEAAELSSKIPLGYPYYAGTLSYIKHIDLDILPEEPEFELTFEDWDNEIHECVEVLLNDQSLGVKPWLPYRWRGTRNILKVGENKLEVRVTNTLVNLLEGRFFDYAGHRLLKVDD